ncbi:hypothetical protein A2Y85_03110, partial [candidate division WOR-3 bacterium RBG_13_43_14]
MIAFLLLIIINNPEINATLDKTYVSKKLTIGDPFEITLEVITDYGTKLNGPFIDSIDPFTVVNVDRKTISGKGETTDLFRLRLIPFQTGDLSVPSVKFLNIDGDQIDTLKSPSIPITIHSVLPADMKDINDLKPAVEYPNYLPLIIFFTALLIAALVYGGYRVYKKYRLIKETPKPLPMPWIEAQIAFENIPLDEWLKKGWIKKYYYTLSEVLKRYLERRYLFNAMEQTTTEIIYYLKMQKVPLRDRFGKFF